MSGLKLDDSDRKRDNWASFFLIENACIQEDLSDDAAMALTRESVATADQLNLKHIRDINMPVKMTIKIN
ncbi:MAG: hypothetical protein CML40_00470 [Rhodobacteraceae bacterium]|nr:MAG: hypothetical protein CML40_00470 [Paracoccaceae bacterium]|tara:strand:- start:265 stop:474 length:210 start_codon:yes stop_codon:yes gene_type:complete